MARDWRVVGRILLAFWGVLLGVSLFVFFPGGALVLVAMLVQKEVCVSMRLACQEFQAWYWYGVGIYGLVGTVLLLLMAGTQRLQDVLTQRS